MRTLVCLINSVLFDLFIYRIVNGSSNVLWQVVILVCTAQTGILNMVLRKVVFISSHTTNKAVSTIRLVSVISSVNYSFQ